MSDNEGWTVVNRSKPKKPKSQQKRAYGPVSETYDHANQYPSFGDDHDRDVVFRKRRPPPKVQVQRTHVMSDEQKRMARLANDDDVRKPKTVKPELSKKIRDYRQGQGLSQAELAQKLNVTVSVVNTYEKGTAIHDPKITSKFYRLFSQTLREKQNAQKSNK